MVPFNQKEQVWEENDFSFGFVKRAVPKGLLYGRKHRFGIREDFWAIRMSVRLCKKSAEMRAECRGQRPGAHPPRLTGQQEEV